MIAPVFLVGCPRSGTTLLQRLLDSHPFVAIAPETHFVRRFWIPRVKYGALADETCFRRLVDDVVGMPEFADMKLDPARFHAAAGHGERTVPALFDLLLRSFGDRRRARIVGEKTPNHLLYMPILESFFPGARFVHIIRDPRAVVSSWRTVPWSTGTLGGDAAVWRRYLRTAWKQPPSRGKLHVMRYEALTSDPEHELRRVCDFLGIPFDPSMLSFHQREAETIDFEREPWKRGTALPIQGRAHDKWRRALSPGEVEAIEQVCWAEMVRLGYEPEEHRGPPLLGPARRVMKRLVSRVR
jgi:hypothetical protein